MTGSRFGASGARAAEPLPFDLFVGPEGGYTTVAVAVALLVSLSLVFGAAAAGWVSSRSAEVQEVADACAMAGANCVAAFSTIAQTTDACVLSLGLTGVLVEGAGLLMMVIPGGQAAGAKALEVGGDILRSRRRFARSAARGLSRLERALPALIALNSASCALANSRGGIEYVGVAVPYPQRSESSYDSADDGLDNSAISDTAQELAREAARKQEADRAAQRARERAWQADCVDNPLCLRSRAETLAGLGGVENPSYPSPAAWRFEYARIRARNYYLVRYESEAPQNGTLDELTRSAARACFYRHAFRAISAARCVEGERELILDLPELPYTSDMVRASDIYRDGCWPCTYEEGEPTLHSSDACPGATGDPAGSASLSDLEEGLVRHCDECGMDVGVMGSVAAASTRIDNGFEHYWRIVVEESRAYQQAREEAREAEGRLEEIGEQGAGLFQQAIDTLSVERPSLRPPGAWGCVAVCARPSGRPLPSELTAFASPAGELPSGLAISAATLAPDATDAGGTVLSRLLDGIGAQRGPALALVGNVCELWSRLLVSYGAAFERVSDVADDLLDRSGGSFGGRIAGWLKGRLSGIVRAAGFAPVDLRLRKPVLVHSQEVLDRAGLSSLGVVRSVISELPSSAQEAREAFLARVRGELGGGSLTIAELPIPGLPGVSVPLTIDLAGWGVSP